MAMDSPDLKLLFGVLGGASASGESGKLIHEQLTGLMKELNQNPFKIKIGVDTESSRQIWGKQIQDALNSISKSGNLSIQISEIQLSADAVERFRKQIGSIINTTGLSSAAEIPVSFRGTTEAANALKSVQTALGNTGSSAAEASSKISTIGDSAERTTSKLREMSDAASKSATMSSAETMEDNIKKASGSLRSFRDTFTQMQTLLTKNLWMGDSVQFENLRANVELFHSILTECGEDTKRFKTALQEAGLNGAKAISKARNSISAFKAEIAATEAEESSLSAYKRATAAMREYYKLRLSAAKTGDIIQTKDGFQSVSGAHKELATSLNLVRSEYRNLTSDAAKSRMTQTEIETLTSEIAKKERELAIAIKDRSTNQKTAAKSNIAEIAALKVQAETLTRLKNTVGTPLSKLEKTAATDDELARIREINTQYEQWAAKIEQVKLKGEIISPEYRAELEAEGRAISDSITQLREQRAALEEVTRAKENAAASKTINKNPEDTEKDIADQKTRNALVQQYLTLLSQMQKVIKNSSAANSGKTRDDYQWIVNNAAALDTLGKQFRQTGKDAEKFRAFLQKTKTEFAQHNAVIKENGKNVKTFGERMAGLAQKFSMWFSATHIIMSVVRAIRRMISASIELDSAMTQLEVVTRDTSDAYDEYLNKITKTAEKIGASIPDLIDSTTTFARLGYSLEESKSLAEFTSMLKNVGDIDVSDAQNAITAIIKAFGVSVNEIESIMDKLVVTGNNFPISVSQIAEGMNNASSALASAGNSFEQSVALLTAANTTIQNAAKSSTGLRTIAARLRSTKTELDELGESMTEAEYEKLVSSLTKYNVALTDQNNEFRSTYDVMADIAAIWDKLSTMEQAALANTIAGVRQQSVFYSLVEQFQEASGAMEAMADSSGTLQEAYGTVLDSVTAHINRFKAAFQSLGQTMFPQEFLTGVVDFGTDLLNILGTVMQLINAIGGLKTVLVATAAIVMTINANTIVSSLAKLQIAIGSLIGLIPKLTTAMVVFRSLLNPPVANASTAMVVLGYPLSIFQKLAYALNTVGIAATSAQAAMGLFLIGAIAAFSIYKKLHKSTDELVESSNKLKESFQNVKEQTESNVKTLNGLSDEFERLANGVDQYGKNISLSADDYKRYKEIVEQIVSISPSLIEGYDKENGYLVDKNNLLERAIELQEEEYRNELRRMTTISNISSAVAGSVATYYDLSFGDALKTEGALETALRNLFNQRMDIPRDMENGEFFARQVLDALGVDNVEEELGKYFDEYGNWSTDRFFNDYIGKIAEDIDSGHGLILPSIDFESSGFESRDDFIRAVEDIEDAAREYSDVQSELEQANEDVSNQLKLVAESNQQYADLSNNAKEIISNFVDSFGVEDITKRDWLGRRVIDEGAISRVKTEISDFVEKFTPEIQQIVDEGASLKLGLDIDGNELSVSEYREQVANLLGKVEGIEDDDLQLHIRTSLGIDADYSSLESDVEKAIAHVKSLLIKDPIDEGKPQGLFGEGELQSLLDQYKEEVEAAKELGVDLSRTVYGNIDTNNRQILEWTEENLNKYKSALESWDSSIDEMRGSMSTVFGSSSEYEGVEIAFSPILQTEDGPVFLSSHAVDEYIYGLIDNANGDLGAENLLRLDAKGLEFDGVLIKNLLADIGDTAIKTGEAMHYVGNLGGIQTSYDELKDAAISAGISIEELNQAIENGDTSKLKTVEELIDGMSIKDILNIYYNISAAPNSMTFEELQRELETIGVDWNKTLNVWDFSSMVDGLGNIESGISDIASAMNTLQSGTALTVGEMSKLALKYPELLKASSLFTDTSIENQQELLGSVLGTYESEYDALIDTKIKELEATKELIDRQIVLENEKKNKVVEIADLQANGQLDSEEDYQTLLNGLRDLEGRNFVTYSDSTLDVNKDMLNKMLEQQGEGVDESAPIWGTLGDMIVEGHTDGLTNALKAFPEYVAKLGAWAGTSLRAVLSNIGTNIEKALHGDLNFVPWNEGISSIGSVVLDNAKAEISTKVEGGYTIDEKSVAEWAAGYEDVIKKRVQTLTDQKTGLQITIDNLEKLKGLDLKSIYMDKSGKGKNASEKKTEEYIADTDAYYEALKRLEAIQIRLSSMQSDMESAKTDREKITLTKQLVDVYNDEIDALSNLNTLRKNTIKNGIVDLQALGFEIEYDENSNEFLVKNLDRLNQLTGSTQEETNELRKNTEKLIETLDGLNSANQDGVDSMREFKTEISESKQQIIDYLKNIVTSANDTLDEIQSVYNTLKTAADEYADNGGFISVDTFQDILALGPQYMQYLRDENGVLVINEESINRVIAAKTRQLAAEQALTYVERLRLALQEGSVEKLNTLLYATTESTNATFGLAYAELSLMRSTGELNEQQYAAALHNIQSIESVCNAAINGIGKVAGEYGEKTKEELNNMKSGLDDILKYVMDMLKHKIQQQVEALEDMKDAYGDIIDLRKEALDVAKNEADYEDKVAEKVKAIAKLQERINALSLDDSRDAQAQKMKLEEELAELQKELADDQNNHAVDAQKDALDDMQDAYEKEKDAEIKALEDTISSYQKLYDMAIDYIQDNWDALYQELLSWNSEYGSVLNSEITNAWDNCLAAAERYGDYVSALTHIDADIKSAETNSGNKNNTAIGNMSNQTQPTREETISRIITRMYENGQAWGSASAEEKQKLADSSLRLGIRLKEECGIQAKRDENGVWHDESDGSLLFEKYKKYIYHSGGIAGDNPTLKQNEIMAVLEKGEVVLNEQKERGLYRLIEFATTLSDKFSDLIRSSNMKNALVGTGGIANMKPDIPHNITNNESVSIEFGNTIIYGANNETVEKHRAITRQQANELFDKLNIKR